MNCLRATGWLVRVWPISAKEEARSPKLLHDDEDACLLESVIVVDDCDFEYDGETGWKDCRISFLAALEVF